MCILGKGGFGTVYKVRYQLDNNIYAVKKVKLHLGFTETLLDHRVYREIQAITMLDPKNIIRYYTCWIEALEDGERNVENRLVQQLVKSKLAAGRETLMLKNGDDESIS